MGKSERKWRRSILHQAGTWFLLLICNNHRPNARNSCPYSNWVQTMHNQIRELHILNCREWFSSWPTCFLSTCVIDCFAFYAVSVIFQPHDSAFDIGPNHLLNIVDRPFKNILLILGRYRHMWLLSGKVSSHCVTWYLVGITCLTTSYCNKLETYFSRIHMYIEKVSGCKCLVQVCFNICNIRQYPVTCISYLFLIRWR